jgi:hypothetical protein
MCLVLCTSCTFILCKNIFPFPFGCRIGIVFVKVCNLKFTCLEPELHLSRLSKHLFEQDMKQHNYIANMTIIFFFFFTFFIKKKNCRPSIKLGFDNKYNIFSDNKCERVLIELICSST